MLPSWRFDAFKSPWLVSVASWSEKSDDANTYRFNRKPSFKSVPNSRKSGTSKRVLLPSLPLVSRAAVPRPTFRARELPPIEKRPATIEGATRSARDYWAATIPAWKLPTKRESLARTAPRPAATRNRRFQPPPVAQTSSGETAAEAVPVTRWRARCLRWYCQVKSPILVELVDEYL